MNNRGRRGVVLLACRVLRLGHLIAPRPASALPDALDCARARNTYPRTQHVRDIRIAGKVHNNKMERLNGEFRDREKVMRGLKRTDSPILKGYQLFHNYIRPHEALKGRTPADLAGIKVKGENKWLTIIQNASKSV